MTPQRPPWCRQCQQIKCQCCESWRAHGLPSHLWDMLGVTGETEAGWACDIPYYPGEGFGRTTRPSWLWRKAGHCLQQGIARARPCPRAQMGPWAGVGHVHGCTRVCSQESPARPCVPVCEHVCFQHRAPVPGHVTHPLRSSKELNRAWHHRVSAGHWEGWCSAGNGGGQGAGWGLWVSCAPGEGMGLG